MLARARAFIALACVAVACAFPAVAGAQLAALDARLGGDGKHTRLVVDLTAAVTPNYSLLADPYRIVIDLPQTEFRLPSQQGREGRGLISAFRYGLIAAGRSRIVIDLEKPVSVEKLFVLDPVDGQPARLVLDVVPAAREAFMAAMAARGALSPERAARKPAPAPAPSGDRRPLVVLDPGHGGIDPGAMSSNGFNEKDIVLEVARKLRDKLDQTGRYRTLMTRDGDNFIALGDRVRVARDAGAALFISIHADSLGASEGVRGATVYTLSDRASDTEAARLAEKENRADIMAGVELPEEMDDVAGILIDLMQRETRGFSTHFASTLTTAMKDSIRLNRNPRRSAGFRVLRAPDVPSVLLELGYMSSPQDVRLLTSDQWRDNAASAIVTAIDEFFDKRVARGLGQGVN